METNDQKMFLMTLINLLQKVTQEEEFDKIWQIYSQDKYLNFFSFKRLCALFFIAGKAVNNQDITIGNVLNGIETPSA